MDYSYYDNQNDDLLFELEDEWNDWDVLDELSIIDDVDR